MANALPPQGQGPFGKYWLEKRIAVGGSSEVYLAREQGPAGAPLVIKRLLPELRSDPPSIGMFAREAQLHRIVRHPNVVEVFEAGEVAGEPYLAMQYVDGIDAFRLLRRAQAEDRPVPEPLAIYVGRCLCDALDSVHNARDAAGHPLGILHRDVTPSNVYLSSDGDVLLGDFGIARAAVARGSRPQLQNSALRGKYSYLSPEQISGEPADHRADLFSCAVVVSELVLGRPLFAGAGQVAVLLAIRDGRIDALRSAARRMSLGLFDVLNKALARDPAERYPSARALSQALSPFEGPREQSRHLVREWVAWARDARELARRLGGALIESEARIRQSDNPDLEPHGAPTLRRLDDDELIPASSVSWDDREPITARMDELPSQVRFHDGRTLGAVRFARLIEMVVTGELGPDDEVDLMGQGFRRVTDVELLERHLPSAATTRNLQVPAPPDETADLSQSQLLPLLGRLWRLRETGLLLVEGRGQDDEGSARREVYLQAGQLLHIASGESGDLLGQSLVRGGLITSEELDMALAVIPRFQGRLGDTLIALGLVDAVTLFRAIQEQGRSRFARMFTWTQGQAMFFRGAQPARVEFPLELDLPSLLLAGVEAAYPNDTPIILSRSVLGMRLRCTAESQQPGALRGVPRPVLLLLDAASRGVELRHVLARLATGGEAQLQPADSLRAMYVAIALGLGEVG